MPSRPDRSAETRKLANSTLKESVGDYIRELIFTGQLRPNERIDQDLVAARLGVSKLPVREALITLESEALVRIVPRRGTFVAPLTPDDVRDHYHIYGSVLGIAASRAATRLSQADLDQLEQLLVRMESSDSSEEQEELNFEFHRRINVSGGSHRLRSVVRLLANTMPSRFYEFTTGWAHVAESEHWRIMKALRARNPKDAEKAMVAHMRSGGEYAVHMLEAAHFWSSVDGESGEHDEAVVRVGED